MEMGHVRDVVRHTADKRWESVPLFLARFPISFCPVLGSWLLVCSSSFYSSISRKITKREIGQLDSSDQRSSVGQFRSGNLTKIVYR